MNWLLHQLDRTFDEFAPLSALSLIAYFSGIAVHQFIHGNKKARTNKGIFFTIIVCLFASAGIAFLFYLNKNAVNPVKVFVVFSVISLASAFRELRYRSNNN